MSWERQATLNHINKGHTLTPVSTDHLSNVPLTETHDLVQCSCGDRGWLPKKGT